VTGREANEVMRLHPARAEQYIRDLGPDTAIDLADDLDLMAYVALGYARFAREFARTERAPDDA
jgi:hypothetical protein